MSSCLLIRPLSSHSLPQMGLRFPALIATSNHQTFFHPSSRTRQTRIFADRAGCRACIRICVYARMQATASRRRPTTALWPWSRWRKESQSLSPSAKRKCVCSRVCGDPHECACIWPGPLPPLIYLGLMCTDACSHPLRTRSHLLRPTRLTRHTDYVRGLCTVSHTASREGVGLISSSWDRSMALLPA